MKDTLFVYLPCLILIAASLAILAAFLLGYHIQIVVISPQIDTNVIEIIKG